MECQQALLTAAVMAVHPGHLQLLAGVLSSTFRQDYLTLRMDFDNRDVEDTPGCALVLAHQASLHTRLCVCRLASPAFCDAMLEALAALQRAAALAAAQQALPPLPHLSELLGVLLLAAPDDTRTAWQTRLSQVHDARCRGEHCTILRSFAAAR
jgi:hypothetical protein